MSEYTQREDMPSVEDQASREPLTQESKQAGTIRTVDSEISYKLASVTNRAVAFLIDFMIIGIINLILIQVVGFNHLETMLSVNTLFLGLTASLYFILFTRYYSQTPGKMLIGIKVLRKDGAAMDWKTVMIRELFGKIVSQVRFLYLGYLYCLVSRQNQCWHDIFADTYVVRIKDKERRSRYVTLPSNPQEIGL